ncbi:MAG TPA: hypothetical protein VHY31_19720 [Streptosporangiaceae bacterium]|jgi:hypothetical protein|nr:hypothetical protein [Streptosporangiaceae bacterium]
MHAMISQAVAAERTRDLRAKAASEQIARQARRVGAGERGGRISRAGLLRRVLGQSRRTSPAAKV